MEADCIFSCSKVGLFYSNSRPPLASEAGCVHKTSNFWQWNAVGYALHVSKTKPSSLPSTAGWPRVCLGDRYLWRNKVLTSYH